MDCIWCNGEFIEGPLTISPTDRGLTHGLGIFETLLVLDGKPQVLEMHLDRMRDGTGRLGWDHAQLDGDLISRGISGLLERRNLGEGRVRVRLAMSAGAGDLRNVQRGEDFLIWMTASSSPMPPDSIAMVTAPFPRNEASPLAGIKCASYAESLWALDFARRNGADEALFYNTKDELCEGTTSNIFVVKDGSVFTPPLSSGCLPGITRARVLGKCRDQGIQVAEESLTVSEIDGAEGIFATSSTRGVVPLRSLDGRGLPLGSEIVAVLRAAIGGSDCI